MASTPTPRSHPEHRFDAATAAARTESQDRSEEGESATASAPLLDVQLVVIAKAPVAGKVKTRLCPPCTPEEAALIAESALRDTLAAVAGTPARRHVLAVDGEPGAWLPNGFDVIHQRGAGLDERLANAFDDCFAHSPGPVVIVGMDTPQLHSSDLLAAATVLQTDAPLSQETPGGRAVLGPAEDGGYWLIGLDRHLPTAIRGVPMSEPHTGRAQADRLIGLGYAIQQLRPLLDVDAYPDAQRVAGALPESQFASAVDAVQRRIANLGPALR